MFPLPQLFPDPLLPPYPSKFMFLSPLKNKPNKRKKEYTTSPLKTHKNENQNKQKTNKTKKKKKTPSKMRQKVYETTIQSILCCLTTRRPGASQIVVIYLVRLHWRKLTFS